MQKNKIKPGMVLKMDTGFYTQSREEWLWVFLDKIDFPELMRKMKDTINHRKLHPDWDRPVLMYGIRKKHKCIKRKEIAVIADLCPWSDRARTAETHWYEIIYKRPATDLEWDELRHRKSNRRYVIWSYYLERNWTIDKVVSHIIQDDDEEYGIETKGIMTAFEGYFQRKIRIYKRDIAVQFELFPDE